MEFALSFQRLLVSKSTDSNARSIEETNPAIETSYPTRERFAFGGARAPWNAIIRAVSATKG
jgi:hypothetical protein